MCDKKVIDECSFAFYFGKSTNDLALGGFDSAHAKEAFKYYPLAG
jgi:hypothetical protein